jgi:environmental stress-induced protein Ves
VTGAVEILPAALRTSVAWKNGGGVTREIAAFPRGADLSHFDWRISTAEVRSGGLFSAFPDIERILCVLEGELTLSVQGQATVRLSKGSAPFAFAGDVPAQAEPHGGIVVDLNVMARRGCYVAAVRRVSTSASPTPLNLEADTTLIFALQEVRVSADGGTFRLSRADAARFSGPARCALSGAAGAAQCYVIEIQRA